MTKPSTSIVGTLSKTQRSPFRINSFGMLEIPFIEGNYFVSAFNDKLKLRKNKTPSFIFQTNIIPKNPDGDKLVHDFTSWLGKEPDTIHGIIETDLKGKAGKITAESGSNLTMTFGQAFKRNISFEGSVASPARVPSNIIISGHFNELGKGVTALDFSLNNYSYAGEPLRYTATITHAASLTRMNRLQKLTVLMKYSTSIFPSLAHALVAKASRALPVVLPIIGVTAVSGMAALAYNYGHAGT